MDGVTRLLRAITAFFRLVIDGLEQKCDCMRALWRLKFAGARLNC